MTSLLSLLDQHQPFDDIEAAHMAQLRQFLGDCSNPYDRSNLYAHTVADAWVVSPDRTLALLLVHAASGIWLAPGGHTDGDPDMLASAQRELLEETGLGPNMAKPLLGGKLYDINGAMIPSRQKPHGLEPTHLHFDICFAFEADPATPLVLSDESLDIGWFPIAEALDKVMDCHRRRVEKVAKLLI